MQRKKRRKYALWRTAASRRACNRRASALRIPRDGTVEAGLPLELFFKNVGNTPVLLTHPYDLRDESWIWTLTVDGPRGRAAYHGDTVLYTLTLKELKPGQVARYTGTVRSPVWNISERSLHVEGEIRIDRTKGGRHSADLGRYDFIE